MEDDGNLILTPTVAAHIFDQLTNEGLDDTGNVCRTLLFSFCSSSLTRLIEGLCWICSCDFGQIRGY